MYKYEGKEFSLRYCILKILEQTESGFRRIEDLEKWYDEEEDVILADYEGAERDFHMSVLDDRFTCKVFALLLEEASHVYDLPLNLMQI